MSDEPNNGDNVPDFIQEIQQISNVDIQEPSDKFHQNIVAPLTKTLRAAHERFQTFYETGIAHSKMLTQHTDPYVEQFNDAVHENMTLFHKYRRVYPWEIIGAATAATTIASLPFGAQPTARNMVLSAFVATAMVNPEYMYDKYRQFRTPGSTKVDSTNKTTFRF